jgi:hypothetical protein
VAASEGVVLARFLRAPHFLTEPMRASSGALDDGVAEISIAPAAAGLAARSGVVGATSVACADACGSSDGSAELCPPFAFAGRVFLRNTAGSGTSINSKISGPTCCGRLFFLRRLRSRSPYLGGVVGGIKGEDESDVVRRRLRCASEPYCAESRPESGIEKTDVDGERGRCA